MVYTDRVHLVADSLVELHAFAASMGLKREWFQNGRHPHYDLTTARAAGRAIKKGAIIVSQKNILKAARKLAPAPNLNRGLFVMTLNDEMIRQILEYKPPRRRKGRYGQQKKIAPCPACHSRNYDFHNSRFKSCSWCGYSTLAERLVRGIKVFHRQGRLEEESAESIREVYQYVTRKIKPPARRSW